ncbi:hypothetical protein QFC21_004221 [Naganishia friedmannii]|uniref:Uncharacterized protein n=1 Tax=Naganishia friedmannii TaxID=89922 RepID=A0ACC2VIV2_9TREE|nr:hypothetical protein QFC21_004221 [Naganishia friedmannii]
MFKARPSAQTAAYFSAAGTLTQFAQTADDPAELERLRLEYDLFKARRDLEEGGRTSGNALTDYLPCADTQKGTWRIPGKDCQPKSKHHTPRTPKTNCPFRFCYKFDVKQKSYIIQKSEYSHNHALSGPAAHHTHHRMNPDMPKTAITLLTKLSPSEALNQMRKIYGSADSA